MSRAARAPRRAALAREPHAGAARPACPPIKNAPQKCPRKQAFFECRRNGARAFGCCVSCAHRSRIARANLSFHAKNISKNPRDALVQNDFTSALLRCACVARRSRARSRSAQRARVTTLLRASRACIRCCRARFFHNREHNRRPPPTPSRRTSYRPARERWE